jgi:hypothetical protein
MSPSDRVAQLYPQPPGSFFVTFYDSQGYGGGNQNYYSLQNTHVLSLHSQKIKPKYYLI